MKKALKILKKLIIGFFVLLLVVLVGGYIAIKVVVTKDFVATKIEQNINGRVEIGDVLEHVALPADAVGATRCRVAVDEAPVPRTGHRR